MCFIMKIYDLFKVRLEAKKNTPCIGIQSITVAKTIC